MFHHLLRVFTRQLCATTHLGCSREESQEKNACKCLLSKIFEQRYQALKVLLHSLLYHSIFVGILNEILNILAAQTGTKLQVVKVEGPKYIHMGGKIFLSYTNILTVPLLKVLTIFEWYDVSLMV